MLGKVFGRCQQHRGVAVVPASVHLALVFAGVGEGVELLHGQGVDVGAQANAAPASAAVTPVHDAHHACGAHAAVNGDAPVGQLFGHHIGGAHFLKAKLRVCMNIFANGRDAGRVGEDGVEDFHAISLAFAALSCQLPAEPEGHRASGFLPRRRYAQCLA